MTRPILELRPGQHLTLTPQLQQSIRLLQLSTLDLEAEIDGQEKALVDAFHDGARTRIIILRLLAVSEETAGQSCAPAAE